VYGLVNKAVQDLLVREHGEAVWQQVCERAGWNGETFVRMDQYDDDVTYRLVSAAAEILGAPAEDVLRAFGRYWVEYTSREGYGDLLRTSGRNTVELLENLDTMHSRVGLQYPDLKPPSFHVTDRDGERLRLHYISDRAGLAPMVLGLVEGLGTLFGEEIEIEIDRSREDGAEHDEFLVRVHGGGNAD
jgi:hypothetical protein